MTKIYHYFIGSILSELDETEIDINEVFSVEWQCPRTVTVDYGRDEKTDLVLVQSGLKPVEDYYAERGLDFK